MARKNGGKFLGYGVLVGVVYGAWAGLSQTGWDSSGMGYKIAALFGGAFVGAILGEIVFWLAVLVSGIRRLLFLTYRRAISRRKD
jgi:hypothetical protein